MIDLVEPLEEGPACLLFTKEFYTLVRDRLTERGVMTMQAGMTKVNEIFFFGAVNRTLREVFPVVAPYQGFISCFGTPWGFILAGKGDDPRQQSAGDIDRLIAERLNPGDLEYWDGAGAPAFLQPAEVPPPLGGDQRTGDHGFEPSDRHLSGAAASLILASASSAAARRSCPGSASRSRSSRACIAEEHPPVAPAEAITAVALAKARAVARGLPATGRPWSSARTPRSCWTVS